MWNDLEIFLSNFYGFAIQKFYNRYDFISKSETPKSFLILEGFVTELTSKKYQGTTG